MKRSLSLLALVSITLVAATAFILSQTRAQPAVEPRAAAAPGHDGSPPPAWVAIVPLAEVGEPGDKLEFYGRVFDERGVPLARASVIAYGTDTTGVYVPPARQAEFGRSPRLRGVAITDQDGWFRFSTVRPGPYPDAGDPAHIHLHIDAAVHQHMYRTIWFEGDPLITASRRASMDSETVIEPIRKRDDGVWVFRHDIRLSGS